MATSQVRDKFETLASMDEAVMIGAVFAGFLASMVAQVIIDPRINLPNEAYGVVVMGGSAVGGAFGMPYWKQVATGGGVATLDALSDRFGLQQETLGFVQGAM